MRIQQSTRKLIATSGFEGTTITAIADEAGVSAQTIYSVFGSKAAIRENGDARRLGGCRMLAGRWAEVGVLKDNANPEASAEQIWLLTSFETYLLCTKSLGWSSDRYEKWVAESVGRLVFR